MSSAIDKLKSGNLSAEEYNEIATTASAGLDTLKSNLVSTGIGDYLDKNWSDLSEDDAIKQFVGSEEEFEALKNNYNTYVTGYNNFSDLFKKKNLEYEKYAIINGYGGSAEVHKDKVNKIVVDTASGTGSLGNSTTLMTDYSGGGPWADTGKGE